MKIYTAYEWQRKFMEQAGTNKQLLHDLQCTGLIREKDVQEEIEKLKTENKQLRDKINYATGYVANTLMEHTVSGEFIMHYVGTYGDKNDWVNDVYVKELFNIIAQPIKQSDKPKTTKESKI